MPALVRDVEMEKKRTWKEKSRAEALEKINDDLQQKNEELREEVTDTRKKYSAARALSEELNEELVVHKKMLESLERRDDADESPSPAAAQKNKSKTKK